MGNGLSRHGNLTCGWLLTAMVLVWAAAEAAFGVAAAAGPPRSAATARSGHSSRHARVAAPLKAAITALVPFENAPFPYRGLIPDSGRKFMDKVDGARVGHVSGRDGSVEWEDVVFNDRRVLLYVPQGFDIGKRALIVVFFHGNGATLERDVIDRQQVAAQLAAANINAVLVAPQFAVDAADSSAGSFWRRDGFRKFVDEADHKLARQFPDPHAVATFRASKVVLVAYSGGYLPAAWSLAIGQLGSRLQGVILLDAMYGQIDKFVDWAERTHRSAFLFSAYSDSTRDQNQALKSELADAHVPYRSELPAKLIAGGVWIVATPAGTRHEDFVTQAWTRNPLTWLLSRIPGYPR